MSSYIIDKKEYLKIAGFVSGLSKSPLHGLYTGKLNHELKQEFLTVWARNVQSVCNQYRDWRDMKLLTLEETEEEKQAFAKYEKIGEYAIYDNGLLEEFVLQFAQFISCFRYQTEDDEEREKGSACLNWYLFKMVDLLSEIKKCDKRGIIEIENDLTALMSL